MTFPGTRVLWIIGLLISAFSGAAQIKGYSGITEIKESGFLNIDIEIPDANQSRVVQLGDKNAVLLLQSRMFPNSSNSLTVLQSGDLNSAEVVLSGHETNAQFMQSGFNNHCELSLTADHTHLAVRQLGNDNSVLQKYTYLFDSDLEIIQDGNRNQIMQDIQVPAVVDMKITQHGSGMAMKMSSH